MRTASAVGTGHLLMELRLHHLWYVLPVAHWVILLIGFLFPKLFLLSLFCSCLLFGPFFPLRIFPTHFSGVSRGGIG